MLEKHQDTRRFSPRSHPRSHCSWVRVAREERACLARGHVSPSGPALPAGGAIHLGSSPVA